MPGLVPNSAGVTKYNRPPPEKDPPVDLFRNRISGGDLISSRNPPGGGDF